MNKSAILAFENQKNCFISISEGLALLLKNNSVLEVSGESGKVYSTWNGQICSGQTTVTINGLYAEKQNLKDGKEVLIRCIDGVQQCQKVFVEPLSIDDWEILEMHAGFIEENLLNQIRVVWTNQVFPVWVNKSICIYVKTGEVEPNAQCVLLDQSTEVHITPKDRRSVASVTRPKQHEHSQISAIGQVPKSKMKKSEKNAKPIKKTRFAVQDTEMHSGQEQTTTELETSTGILSSMFHFVKSFFNSETTGERITALPIEKTEFLENPWKSKLRIQPLGTFIDSERLKNGSQNPVDIKPIEITQQPNNVYISHKTFIQAFKYFSEDMNMTSFLACLAFLPSPSQKEQSLKRSMEKSGQKSSQRSAASSQFPVSGEEEPSGSNDEGSPPKAIVRVIVLDDRKCYRLMGANGAELGGVQIGGDFGILERHIMITDQLRRTLALDVTGRVLLVSLRKDHQALEKTSLEIYPLFESPDGFTSDMFVSAIKGRVANCSETSMPLVVNRGTLLTVPLKPDFDGEFLLNFHYEEPQKQARNDLSPVNHSPPPYITLHRQVLLNMELSVKDQITSVHKPKWLHRLPYLSTQQIDPEIPNVSCDQLGGVAHLAADVLSHVEFCLGQRPLALRMSEPSVAGTEHGGLLICGARGVGRSAFAKMLCRQLIGAPNCSFSSIVNCKQLRGKRVDSILKTLERTFAEASWREPSIIVLDDLDIICGSPAGPEQEMSGDALYFSKVAQVIRDIVKEHIIERSRICVVATCMDSGSIHASVSSPQGIHFFQHTVHIKPPDKKQREDILRRLMQHNSRIDEEIANEIDLTAVANRTEGFVARDLEQVLQRALHTHTILNQDVAHGMMVKLTDVDLDIALNGFTPASLKDVNLHSPADVSWNDVGGLHSVRHALVETLQWPAKYPELFANCPLRLRSGLLLYGAPGTGKTLLASVVAKECGLNFISIKGPELLSKYIGASEQAVRDTFLRAQSAKPCILFFDEFDSLAPRRGHDSTGVTDRVVNQLLTQLDGVEGLEGVYVLAATSRPDLIDPALLRPGRLDKALHCTLPDPEERCEILKSLTRDMIVSSDVNLTELANQCDFFTGADFKALLYNAQLGAIHQQHGIDLGGFATSTNNTEATQSESEVVRKSKNSDSENSVASNSSWEAVNLSPRCESSELVMLEHPRPPLAKQSLTYMPNLEEGVTDVSEEFEKTLRDQVSSVQFGSTTNMSSSKSIRSALPVVIHQRHLQDALKSMGPSVSHSERAKFEAIYAQFVASRGSNFTEMTQAVGKRATLA